ncbi:hypothetical protein cand_032140 [Cryptosporidium andersoni]|uniref:Transmembrane protein n=1 Tax=Cryptosporidium andersoni TaxID=117008 RepID=A0A1J4MF76_9CRYT|nr:hypothetical protein cand_032140 [Cryptosporidium andersoni]
MLPHTITSVTFRTEETPFTLKLRLLLAIVLALQCTITCLRVAILTDAQSIFMDMLFIYLGYVVYTEKSPCILFIFVSVSFVRGVMTLLIMVEWIKKAPVAEDPKSFTSISSCIVHIASPLISFGASFLGYNIFKYLQVIEEVDDQYQFLAPWSNFSANPQTTPNIMSNNAATPNSNNNNGGTGDYIDQGVYQASSRPVCTPFSGRAYKLSDASSIIIPIESNQQIYKGT